jgi:hypothetical protein
VGGKPKHILHAYTPSLTNDLSIVLNVDISLNMFTPYTCLDVEKWVQKTCLGLVYNLNVFLQCRKVAIKRNT